MLQKKVCLLGAFAVGKTSLIKQYVESIFSEEYHTTIGVKIDKKNLSVNQQQLMLMIWDLAGEDAFTQVKTTYLRGMAGYIIVIDSTRSASLEVALQLHQQVTKEFGELPVVFAINKVDLKDQWILDSEQLDLLKATGHPILQTSAKTGHQVENLFYKLGESMLN